MNVLYTAYRMN